MVRPIPMPIDAPLEIPEWTAEEDGVGEEVEDIMRVVGVKVGVVMLELVVMVEVMLLGAVSMLAISDRFFLLRSE